MSVTVSQVASSTSPAELAAADGTRTSLSISNSDPNRLYWLLGTGTPSASLFSDYLDEGESVSFSGPDIKAAVQGVWTGDGSGHANVTKNTDPVVDDNGAISTYAELKAALAAWIKPNTTLETAETTSRVPEYIALFEAEANRTLRTRHMESVDTALAIDDGVAAVPTGFRRVISLRLTDYPYNEVRYLPIDQIERLDPTLTADKPYYFDVVGTSIICYPPTDATARLRYAVGLTPLASDNDTNWLLAKHPDCYLWGSIRNAASRFIDPEQLGIVEANYQRAMEQVRAEERDMIGQPIIPQPSAFVV